MRLTREQVESEEAGGNTSCVMVTVEEGGKKREGRPPTSRAQWATNAWRQREQIYGRLIARCRWMSDRRHSPSAEDVACCRKPVSLGVDERRPGRPNRGQSRRFLLI